MRESSKEIMNRGFEAILGPATQPADEARAAPPMTAPAPVPPPVPPAVPPVAAPARESGRNRSAPAPVGVARALEDSGTHPVLIFGTRASGKSTLLTSLLSHFVQDPSAQTICLLGDAVVPGREDAHEQARRFFNRVVSDFHNGTAALRTEFPTPFFIPVDLRPRSDKPGARIALMESSGELWSVDPTKADLVRDLHEDVVDVYRNYRGPLSVVILAPYLMRDAYTGTDAPPGAEAAELAECDAAILASLQFYQQYRRDPRRDRFLLVLTKWDVHANQITSEAFNRPEAGTIERLLFERFPRSWGFFQSMPPNAGRNIMNYSAGLIGGRKALTIPLEHRRYMHRYPRRLWSWIYEGATNGEALFGDNVKPPRGVGPRLLSLLSALLR